MTPIIFSHLSDGLYVCEAYPALFLHDRAPYVSERTLENFTKDSSCLVICDSPPGDIDNFKLRVDAFRRDPLLKVAWVKYPDLLDDPGGLRGLRIKDGVVVDRGLFHFRNHTLLIYPGSTLDAGDEYLTCHAPSGKSSPAMLLTDYGSKQAGSVYGDLIIELARHRPGRIKINLELNESDLNLLDAGIRYFFPDKKNGPGWIDSLRFPVFSPGDRKLKCTALLHPLHTLRRNNEKPETLFKFLPSEHIETYFRTPLGQILTLIPGDDAGLVYERKAETLTGRESDDYYLSPWGSFIVSVDGASFPAVMAGMTGTEFVQGGFDGNNLYMTFRNGCNAYLPEFNREVKSNHADEEQEDALFLEKTATTSYVRFHGGLATYYAQPSEQPFYLPRGSENSAAFLAAPVTNLSDRSLDSIPPIKECVPLLPLSGIQSTQTETALLLEMRMASPVRNEQMKRLQRGDEDVNEEAYTPIPINSSGGILFSAAGTSTEASLAVGDGVSCVTPGGYVADFSHDMSQWKRLIITTGSNKQPLAIKNISGPLRNALLASRRMTVISDPILFLQNTSILENPLLNIAGWGFDLDPELWFRFNTVLVFKDHPESMEELIKKPGTWTEGQFLNIDPWDTSERLIELAELAREAVDAGDMDFAPFLYQIWQNPNWNGFIAFNVPVSPTGFPDDLAVIAGGVDPSALKAHHVGVSSSAIERQESGNVVSGRGALFGLVNYENDAEIEAQGPWGWSVRILRARFRNSRLQSFQARIDLQSQEFFGEKASTVTNYQEKTTADKKLDTEIPAEHMTGEDDKPADTIILLGHYEEHDGKGRYSFRSKEKTRFYLESGILHDIVLQRASFETISVIKSSDGTKMDVLGRFLLSGHMKFCEQEGFDIFSYNKIPASNLALDLAFSVSSKAKERPLSDISFSIDQLRILPDAAKPRDLALVNRFPLALDSIRLLPQEGLADLKLASVISPISQSTRSEQGYLMEYRIDLGLGALKTFLTIAWWPSGMSPTINMGLRIPGFDGSFSMVDDLIKIGPEQMQFLVDPNTRETVLLFRRLGIEMPLGISLPTSGSIDAALFGDPDGGGRGDIAWYAAWNKPK